MKTDFPREERAPNRTDTGRGAAASGVDHGVDNDQAEGGLSQREHVFVAKTILKLEKYDSCGERLTFGKQGLTCQGTNVLFF